MSRRITFERVHVQVGSRPEEGRLVFIDKVLRAVLTRLDAEHGELAGFWHCEAAFGLPQPRDPFPSLGAVRAWLTSDSEPRGPPEPSA